MKHLASLITLTLTIVGFAPAQSVTVSRDTVLEKCDCDGSNPLGQISFLNTTPDTLFTDTVIVDLLTSPVPERIRFQFDIEPRGGGGITIFVSEDYQLENVGGTFAPGVEYTLEDFCLDGFVEGGLLCRSPDSIHVQAVIKVRWYFTSGDSLLFYVEGDYQEGVVSIGPPMRRRLFLQGTAGKNYLINGKSIQPDRIRKTPLPVIERSNSEKK